MQAAVDRLSLWLQQPTTGHALHHPERAWPQTNCSVDLMIELVAALGHDPTWMLAFTLTQDFEGDHFGFFKVPNADLEALYGLSVQELAVWDDLETHVVEQVALGRVVLVEVDGYFLPDTRGVTYHEAHGKTTIGIAAIDTEQRQLHYFHNETHGLLTGSDYSGALQRLPEQAALLMPYCEIIKPLGPPAADPATTALAQLRHHWQRRPAHNPFEAYATVLPDHVARVAERGQPYFHAYAFNTLRQFGANFGLMASLLTRWDDPELRAAADCAQHLADQAKVLQFKLARAASKRRADGLTDAVLDLAAVHTRLMGHLAQSALLGLEEAATPAPNRST